MFKPGFTHVGHMRRALRLAKKGRGLTNPNPMVGAILVKDNERISEGYHKAYGENHAEVEALNNLKGSAKGATLYVTLEPCCHTGKTPPCTKVIIESGIKKVIIASKDPSEKVSGKGIEELKKHNIEVQTGILDEEAKELNKAFFTFHEKKRPYINLKAALSLDGKLSASRLKSTPLTSKRANKLTHSWRSEYQAILVGGGTIISDNPHLGVRETDGKDPLRVILKGKRDLPGNSQIFRDNNILVLEEMSIPEALNELYLQGVISVLVEGGQGVIDSFLASKCVDEINLFYTPIILGNDAVSFSNIKEKLSFSKLSVQQLGPDVLIHATPKWDSSNG